MLSAPGAPALRLPVFARWHAATGAAALLSMCAALSYTIVCVRQGMWCVPHYWEDGRRRRGFSLVHLRAFRAGCEHRLVSWCTCSGKASVAEVLFDNQVRVGKAAQVPAPCCTLFPCSLTTAHQEPTQEMYGLEATHPQYPQAVELAVRMPGQVTAKSWGQDDQVLFYNPNKEQDRQGQASSNELPTDPDGAIPFTIHIQSSQQAQGPTNRNPTT